MAVLPSSGPLSINDIASVMGGTAPHGLNEYYRGGGLVPSTRTVTYTQGPFFQVGVYVWFVGSPDPPYAAQGLITWDSVDVYNSEDPGSSVYVAPYTYIRGAFYDFGGGGTRYYVSRSISTSTSINASVPTSGQISISNFYGADNGQVEGPFYTPGSYIWFVDTDPSSLLILWNGTTIYEANRADAPSVTSLVVGSYTYFRGPFDAGVGNYSVYRNQNL